eukprot:TRINITY_DN69387_c0_g1_i1.p1 TRINITY_DN69387_c0_g1~~TRINITY_DN69387_c0_g1_i1.p1  ORF type:complete len:291 (+),score=53.12 TRINITY_DN69387_c0_g1_i1:150-1022(+)
MASKPVVQCFFEKNTNTAQYVVSCPQTSKCAIIDSVWDFDAASGHTSTTSIDALCAFMSSQNLELQWIIDTHVHADHLSGMDVLKKKFPNATTGIGAEVTTVIKTFSETFEVTDIPADGSHFDCLFHDGDTYRIGNVVCTAISTPGHTPACYTHVMGDAAFCGDTIFLPDQGTARCDFPGGSAASLYASVTRKLFALPDSTRLFVGHDYGADGAREIGWSTTIGDEKAQNKKLSSGTPEESFVSWRRERDSSLGMPKLIIPALQVNLRAGKLPPTSPGGKVFLKLPVNVF